MNSNKNKKLIVSLIKDDLIHAKLITGLDKLGLRPEIYMLSLSDTIFILLGIKDDEKGEELFEDYLELRQKVETIDLIKSYEALERLALDIYNDLLERKKILVQRNTNSK